MQGASNYSRSMEQLSYVEDNDQQRYQEPYYAMPHGYLDVEYQGGPACPAAPGSGIMDYQGMKEPGTSRRAASTYTTDIDDDTDDCRSTRTMDDSRKQNHSEIEKRRRDKMNTYITELSAMIPMSGVSARKMDKLTVLRHVVQHIKTVRGAANTETPFGPAYLSDAELKRLILQIADGFVFAVGCDRGRLLYVSQSVEQILNYQPSDLLGQSWFDFLHPEDIVKVKDQISSPDNIPRERLIDAKTLLPMKPEPAQSGSQICSGARRSFFCRMKSNSESSVKLEEHVKPIDRKYLIVHCTGYIKSLTTKALQLETTPEGEGDGDVSTLSCLVAVGRLLPPCGVPVHIPGAPAQRTITYTSRHTLDAKFLFLEESATLVLGYMPHELVNMPMFDYYHQDDAAALSDVHQRALTCPTYSWYKTPVYKFRARDGSFVSLRSEWRAFKNPWTKELEFMVGRNEVVPIEVEEEVEEKEQASAFATYFKPANKAMARSTTNNVSDVSSPNPASPGSEPGVNLASTSHFESLPDVGDVPGDMADDVLSMINAPALPTSLDAAYNDGNDEAAMAVIMSLLEADAGLGGPVDFSGLPWPLP